MMQGKELVLGTGTGFVGDSGCGFAVRERRRHSLRRRRSGGPELFACAARRGSTAPPPPHSAQLPPLPQSATCSHAKLKVLTSAIRDSFLFYLFQGSANFGRYRDFVGPLFSFLINSNGLISVTYLKRFFLFCLFVCLFFCLFVLTAN